MSDLSTAERPILHRLRLVGSADTAQLTQRVGVPEAQVRDELTHAVEAGLARVRGTDRPVWTLTEHGRTQVEAWLHGQLEQLEIGGEVEQLYDRFLVFNPRILGLCTDWQMREVDGELVLNDHRDSVHDRWVLTQLQATHREARPVVVSLGEAAPWFDSYAGRLDHALDEVLGGRPQWLDSPTVDSYHSVWFELHEDLLVTLGRDRHDETVSAAGDHAGGSEGVPDHGGFPRGGA